MWDWGSTVSDHGISPSRYGQTPMGTPSLLARLRLAKVREWPLFQLAPLPRWHVIAVTAAAAAAIAVSAVTLPFEGWQLADFAVLLTCGLGNVLATRRINYPQGVVVRDLLTVWALPVAISLPPLYALIIPVPLLGLTQICVRPRAVPHRRVFTTAAIGLAYAAASWAFHSLPLAIAGPAPGTGTHVVRWLAAVAVCDALAWGISNAFIAMAIKSSDRTARAAELFSKEALAGDYVQWTAAVVIALLNAISPVLPAFAWPLVLLTRRALMHKQLVSRARVDAKTGLLNAAAWEREATVTVDRAHRAGTPLAVALVDIDRFKDVNDTYGHLVGDKVLRTIADRIQHALRPDDLPGRFGGEEFSLLLPGATTEDAHGVAERLREAIARAPITFEKRGQAYDVQVTVSVGVATLNGGQSLTELLAAADAAMYQAKDAGRNCTCVVTETSRLLPRDRASGKTGTVPPATA